MLSSLLPDPELTPRIHAAIDTTKEIDPSYWDDLCRACDPRLNAEGRVLILPPGYVRTVEDILRLCEWSSFSGPGLRPGTIAFRTFDIQGYLDIQPIAFLKADERVSIRNLNGHAEALVNKPRSVMASYTTIVLGPDPNDLTRERVFSLHPGALIVPSVIPPQEETELSPADAEKRGFRWAKCIG